MERKQNAARDTRTYTRAPVYYCVDARNVRTYLERVIRRINRRSGSEPRALYM